MPSSRDVVSALYGAWRLMRFDAGGMAWFDLSIPGFWRSFFAALLAAPFFAVLVGMQFAGGDRPFDPGWATLVLAVAYCLSWAAFPVAAILITRLLRLTDRYVALIVAYNWANVLQIAVILIANLIDASGLLPGSPGVILPFAVMVFVLVYQWFVTRTALASTTATAIGVVIIQLVIDVFIELAAESLI
ncbi:MAG: hypothetical protein IIA01_02205 [Proteobacteria bacterium]|nr:hypothetical protein [Pseudomonadota bacterium]